MMDRTAIYDKVRTMVAEVLGVQESEINESSRLVDDLGAESLDLLSLLFELEEGFDTEIPEAESAGLKTVKDVVDWVERFLAAREA